MLSYDALADDIPADRIVDRVHAGGAAADRGAPAERHARPDRLRRCRRRRTAQRRAAALPAGRGLMAPARDALTGPRTARPARRSRPLPTPSGPTPTLARLQLLITRKLDGLLQGDYLGLLPGPGSEPGESREYRPGDDVRRMDWPVTARTTVPHVRQTIADRELETWLAVDLSASLDFGTALYLKRDLAVAAAAAVAHLTVRGGNRIGAVIGTGSRLTRLPHGLAAGQHVRCVLDQARPRLQTPQAAGLQAPDLTQELGHVLWLNGEDNDLHVEQPRYCSDLFEFRGIRKARPVDRAERPWQWYTDRPIWNRERRR